MASVMIHSLSATSGKITVSYIVPHTMDVDSKWTSNVWNSIKLYYGLSESSMSGSINVTSSTKPGSDTNTATITGLSADTTYYVKLEAIPSDGNFPCIDIDSVTTPNPKALKAKPILLVGNADGSTWTDFTDCLVAPDYKVNRLPVSEEWEDANWVKHKVTPRKRIQGSFMMLFTDKAKYNKFVALLGKNEAYNNRGPGVVKLKLQVNNEMDIESTSDYEIMMPKIYKALFYIEWEPTWFVPFIGVKEYDAIEVTIEEE